jgi:kumamolisin
MPSKNEDNSTSKVPVPGSERLPLVGSRAVGPVDPNQLIEVTIRLRRAGSDDLESRIKEMANQLPSERHYLTTEELETDHGANPDDVAKIEQFAILHGLQVVRTDITKRAVVLQGTASVMNATFGVELERYEYSKGSYRGRTGYVHVPTEIASIIEGVFGLDDRPQAEPHFRHYKISGRESTELLRRSVSRTFTPPELAKLYNFPTDRNGSEMDGRGQCIATIELGGGYRESDLDTYFSSLGIPKPDISSVPGTRGADNQPTGNPKGPDGEVMLDIEIVAAVAPKAKIVVYFDKPDDRGFLAAVNRAIHDNVHKPSVISISWGKPEEYWTDSNRRAFNGILQDAAALGITVCCASGDNGSSDERPSDDGHGIPDSDAHVDFPASSAFALACGGTHVTALNGSINKEIVWNDPDGGATGGGISIFMQRPEYQRNLVLPTSVNGVNFDGRGLPDVSGDASPSTGYRVRVDGRDFPIGGTSAVAPLWAGLIALINQAIDNRVGFLNTLLYTRLGPNGVLHDITSGNNGLSDVKVIGEDQLVEVKGYPAETGWDPSTGWGSPDGKKLLSNLV